MATSSVAGQGSFFEPPKVSKRGARLGANEHCREPLVLRPFNAGVPEAALFPWKTWERCSRHAQESLGRDGLNHCDSLGYQPLRIALSRYLAQFRGVRASPEQVVVFNSTAQALHTLFLLLLDPSDTVWVEEPGFPGAKAAAEVVGARPIGVPVDAEGIQVATGRKRAPRARLAYVTPSHQYPTGAWLSQERRRDLLSWAAERRALIVEDDYDADFRYHGEPLTPLYAQDGGQRVLYVGTLSKAMFLGLRVAYAVVPESLVEQVGSVRAQVDGFSPIGTQAALTGFIDGGHLATHVRQMRRAYAEKRSMLLDQLAPMIDRGWTPGPSAAGMHFVLYEPTRGLAKRLASSSRLALTPLSHYGKPLGRDGLSIRFGGLSLETLTVGTKELCVEAKKL